jgi:ribonuclease PH
MENNISEIAADTVMCELYPKAEITVLVQVIESDGYDFLVSDTIILYNP